MTILACPQCFSQHFPLFPMASAQFRDPALFSEIQDLPTSIGSTIDVSLEAQLRTRACNHYVAGKAIANLVSAASPDHIQSMTPASNELGKFCVQNGMLCPTPPAHANGQTPQQINSPNATGTRAVGCKTLFSNC